MNNLKNMDNLSQKEEIFLNLYTKHKHNETSDSIKKTHGHLINDKMNFESVQELASNYMHIFGKTNGKEMFDFIQKNKVTFSDNKFKSIFSAIFNKDIEVNIDFQKIKENVFDDFDLVTKQAAIFLKEVGCNESQVKVFLSNSEKFKTIAETLVHDYFIHTRQALNPEKLEGKHLVTILNEMGNDYNNIKVVFRDAKDKDSWRYEHGLLIMPSKALVMHHHMSIDLINNLGGGYEISAIVKDKKFFDKITKDHMSYIPYDRLVGMMKKELQEHEEPAKKKIKQTV